MRTEINVHVASGTVDDLPIVDLTQPKHGLEVRVDGDRLWVNVDGICVMRVCRVPNLQVEVDGRLIREWTLP